MTSTLGTDDTSMTLAQARVRLPWGAGRRIAQRLGVNQSAVSKVLRGRMRSKRIENAIAQTLGIPRESLFGLNEHENRGGQETAA